MGYKEQVLNATKELESFIEYGEKVPDEDVSKDAIIARLNQILENLNPAVYECVADVTCGVVEYQGTSQCPACGLDNPPKGRRYK